MALDLRQVVELVINNEHKSFAFVSKRWCDQYRGEIVQVVCETKILFICFSNDFSMPDYLYLSLLCVHESQ